MDDCKAARHESWEEGVSARKWHKVAAVIKRVQVETLRQKEEMISKLTQNK